MKKILWATFALLAFAYSAHAQTTDYSLSASGWVNGPSGTATKTGTQTIQAGSNAWAISPYTGSTMVGLTPTSPTATYSNMTNALGMSAASVSALSAEIAAQNPQGGGNITNAAWVYKDFPLAAATKFSMYWVYTSTDYVPFNDGSITTFVNTGNAAALGKINNVLTQYLLLGATNPGTGNYSTNSYGSTGWQIVNYETVDAGTYRLGFASFNQGDTALSPVLYVNDGLGTVTKNGQTFGAVAPNNPNMPTVDPTPAPPAAPTVVSTTPTTPTVTSSTTYGTPTPAASLVINSSTNTGSQFNVTQTTTPVTATPYTITTVTTPKVIKSWSDNTTTTVSDPNNPATTATQTGTAYQFGDSLTATQTASSAALKDAIAYRNFNPFIVDALSIKDGQWAHPMIGYVKTSGGNKIKGLNFGYQYSLENNIVGVAGSIEDNDAVNFQNSSMNMKSYSGTAYWITKQPYVWVKTSVGYSGTEYVSAVNLSSFNLMNNNKVNQKNVYGDLTVYSPVEFAGFRPLFGATIVNSNIASAQEWGSPLLSALPEKKSTTEVRPYGGVRYQLNDEFSVETRVTHSRDFKTVVQTRAVYEKRVSDNVKAFVSLGGDFGSNYRGAVGMVGLSVKF
jgi:hypothetical protein